MAYISKLRQLDERLRILENINQDYDRRLRKLEKLRLEAAALDDFDAPSKGEKGPSGVGGESRI